MSEPEFWLRLARRMNAILAASPDNRIRFLAVDAFDTGTGNVMMDLEHRVVTARAWVWGGKITTYLVSLHLSTSGAEDWRAGRWNSLLPADDEEDWLSISPGDGRMEIRLGRP